MNREVEELFIRSLKAHGGMENWNRVRRISLRVKATGLALASRMKPFAFRSHNVSIDTRVPGAIFHGYPVQGRQGVFSRGEVKIVTEDGSLISRREDPRSRFTGLIRKFYWDHLDALYFGGYALWNYLNLPFLLWSSGFRLEEAPPLEEGGKLYRGLEASFPSDIPTHCNKQFFYFDEAGRIVRHDYTAEVFGTWARASNISTGFEEVGGLTIATRRQVFPGFLSRVYMKNVMLVYLEFDGLRIERH